MALSRVSLQTFLTNARSALRSAIEHRSDVTLVIGNESADLDSFTSSVLYSYLRSAKPSPRAFSQIYVPLLNIREADIALRPEFLALLPHADLQSKDLITLSDLPEEANIRAKLSPEKTQWILVDHNSLQGPLGSIYKERIAGVIDHHEEEHMVPPDTGEEPRIIERAGSCTSLVTNYCRESWDSVTTNEAANFDAQIAKFALASILIDTTNLQSKGKVMPSDEEAVKALEMKIAVDAQSARSFDRTVFFDEISRAKSDIGSLKLQDILRKDYKEWVENGHRLGISSIVKPLSFLLQKAGEEITDTSPANCLLHATERFAQDRRLGLYAMMTTSSSTKGEFQRELMIKALTKDDAQTAREFANEASGNLGLEDWDTKEMDNTSENSIWTKVWWQRNIEHSRKRVAPLLREAMK
ncbi:MAG: hypothetical protein Q9165_008136 [Trypethelium subeluteriae]